MMHTINLQVTDQALEVVHKLSIDYETTEEEIVIMCMAVALSHHETLGAALEKAHRTGELRHA
jgi:hypothetical protein